MNENTKPTLSEVLTSLSIAKLNPMQEAVLARDKKEQNLILLSPTGTGKTLAFLLRVLEQMQYDKPGVQAIIIAPARELVLQIEDVFRMMKTGFKVCVCYGGHNVRTEQQRLEEAPALVIGTPGRLSDHIQKGLIDAATITMVVLDEFDKALEMGFHEQLQVIFMAMNNRQKHLLTSATILKEMPAFMPFRKAETLNFLKEAAAIKLELKMARCKAEEKTEALVKLLCSFGDDVSLVFCNHRDAVERIGTFLKQVNFPNGIFHGAMEQIDRERNLIKFRLGGCNVLIATDLAARGLDIPEIKNVVHYQLPQSEDAFIHRNGRTARMHAEGEAFLILADDEELPAYMDKKIPEITLNATFKLPAPPPFECIYFSAGKKDKISKGDIVGLLMKKGGLKNEEIGLIAITDAASFVAVDRKKASQLLNRLKGEKLKKAKVKIEIAK
jgi:superfamily II DNA/RNA helicase